jgi:hypothetical protein
MFKEIKSRIAMANAAFRKILSACRYGINVKNKLVKCYFWSIALYGAGTWTVWKVDLKYLERFEMWCC